jgi:tetratricopeptide (TPR) repeat protein
MPHDPFSPPSFPPADHPILAELVDNRPRRPLGPWLAVIVLCASVVGAIALFAAVFLPKEIQQWRIAAAEEKRLDGDLRGAIQELDEHIAKNPRDIELRRRRAKWLMENKDYKQALQEIDQVITWRETDVEAYELRAQIHQSMGESGKAVADYKKIITFDSVTARRDRAEALNGLAYARALANAEINEGLVNIDEAMRLVGENAAMLDTRGFLYYRQSDFDRALKDLDHSVDFVESFYQQYLNNGFAGTDPREKKQEDKKYAQMVAVIRYHRSLVHEARDEKEKAEDDRRRVRELGFEPNESLF